jgi:hypothetical protein
MNNISKREQVYYKNSIKDINDDFIEEDNTISSYQIEQLENRSHYLRKYTTFIDSSNRQIVDKLVYETLKFVNITMIYSNRISNRLFFTTYQNNLDDDDEIIITKLNISLFNYIFTSNLIYNEVLNSPIFSIKTYTNREILQFFDWNELFPVIKNLYSSETRFLEATTKIFYSIILPILSTNTKYNVLFLDSNQININKILQRVNGYPSTSSYKINLSQQISNIYSIKLLDIQLPNIIFNVNSISFTNTNGLKFNINSTFYYILENNNFSVTNIESIANTISYNYFNKIAFYDNSGTYYGDYNKYNNTLYSGTGLAIAFSNYIDDNENSINFNSYQFELSFYLFYIYCKSISQDMFNYETGNLYYIYTNDFITNNNKKVLITNTTSINSKLPAILYNNDIIYVNSNVYKFKLITITFYDLPSQDDTLVIVDNNDTLDIGIIVNKSSPTYNFTYKFELVLESPSYNVNNLVGKYLKATNFDRDIYNTLTNYIGINVENTSLVFNATINYDAEKPTWYIGFNIYDTNNTIIGKIINIYFTLVIYTVEYNDIELDTPLYFIINDIKYTILTKSLLTNIDNFSDYYSLLVELGIDNNSDNINSPLDIKQFPYSFDTLTSDYTRLNIEVFRVSDNTSIGIIYSSDYNSYNSEIFIDLDANFTNIYSLNIANTHLFSNYNTDNSKNMLLSSRLVKTNLNDIQLYTTYPLYKVELNSGSYNDDTFDQNIYSKMNSNKLKEYNYFNKDFIDSGQNKTINDPNYFYPRFVTFFNKTTKQYDITYYKEYSYQKYSAYYNKINKYVYFKVLGNKFQNNQRVYLEKKSINNANYQILDIILNLEYTIRILPTYTYSMRLISPSDNANYNTSINNIKSTLEELLDNIKTNPYEYTKDLSNLNTRINTYMMPLINENKNSYVFKDGKYVLDENKEIPLNDSELVICVSNIGFSNDSYKLGRAVKFIDKTPNDYGNYKVKFQMTGETNTCFPFTIGDILYGIDSKSLFCIVPNEWGWLLDTDINPNETWKYNVQILHTRLPTPDIIKLGYINYISLLNTLTEYRFNFLKNSINDFNLQTSNQFSFYKYNLPIKDGITLNEIKNFPWQIWFIQEEANAQYGFEIPLDYNGDFVISNSDISLNFLEASNYCFMIDKSKNDYPFDIMGFNVNSVNDINDTSNLIFQHSFNNTYNYVTSNILEFYYAYTNTNLYNSFFYLKVDNITKFSVGDTVNIANLLVKPIYKRNLFNIYNYNSLLLKKYITFESYINIIAYRLSFVALGIPIPSTSMDIPSVFNGTSFSLFKDIALEINNLNFNFGSKTAYQNFTILNYKQQLIDGEICDENLNTKNNPNITSTLIYGKLLEIRNSIIYNIILLWFINLENLALWTRGDQSLYTYILFNYIYPPDNLARVEIQIDENSLLELFIPDIKIYLEDDLENSLGYIVATSLYKNYVSTTGLIYHIYILAENIERLKSGVYIVDKNGVCKSLVLNNPYVFVGLTDVNPDEYNLDRALYLYETYLRFKIVCIVNNPDENNYNNVLNFNLPDNFNTVYTNIFNTQNQKIYPFEAGYNVFISNNEIYDDTPTNIFNNSYRVMICGVDLNNLIGSYSGTDQPTDENNLWLINILQGFSDLKPQNVILIEEDWNNDYDLNINYAFKYKVRQMDTAISIPGNNNLSVSTISYVRDFIYANKNSSLKKNIVGTPKTLTLDIINLYYYNFLYNLFNDNEINTLPITYICDWSNIINRFNSIYKTINTPDANIETYLNLFDNINILHGIVYKGTTYDSNTETYDKTIYVIFPELNYTLGLVSNNVHLNNFLIAINFIYIDGSKSYNVSTIETNELIESNVIESCVPIDVSAEVVSDTNIRIRIFKLELRFTPKYNIKRGTTIGIRDYCSRIYNPDNEKMKGTNILRLDKKTFPYYTSEILKQYTAIHINMGSNNSIYISYISSQDLYSNTMLSYSPLDFTSEEVNIINSENIVETEDYIEITLLNNLKYNFANGIPVIIRIAPLFTSDNSVDILQNNININLLACEPILVGGEWYTKIYYKGIDNLDINNLNLTGLRAFNKNSNLKVVISDMKGYVIPNIGFQAEERNNIINNVSSKQLQDNTYLKPVPDNTYELQYFLKQDGLNYLEEETYTLPNLGYYKQVYNMNSPLQTNEWIDLYGNIFTLKITVNEGFNYDITKPEDLYSFPSLNKLGRLLNIIQNEETVLLLVEIGISYNNFWTTGWNSIEDNINTYQMCVISDKGWPIYVVTLNDILPPYYSINNTVVPIIPNSSNLPTSIYLNKFIEYNNVSNFINTNGRYGILSIKYNYITIKGKYLGYGGIITIPDNNNIFENINYTVDDIDASNSYLRLSTSSIYNTYYRNNNFMNLDNILYNNLYDINYRKLPTLTNQINPFNSGFSQVNSSIFNYTNITSQYYDIYPIKFTSLIGSNAKVNKNKIYRPYNTNTLDYIFMCIDKLNGNSVVEENNKVDQRQILARIYLQGTLNNINFQVKAYEVVYDYSLLPKLTDLEVYFVDRNNNLINFNDINNSFTLEIVQFAEKVKNISTKNGMVYNLQGRGSHYDP